MQEEELRAHCKWAWPQEQTTKIDVCKISSGTLENSPGGYFVDGVKAQCDDFTCVTTAGTLFLHSTSLTIINSWTTNTKIVTGGLCTPLYCINPSTMTLYKVAQNLPALPDWPTGYISVTGEHIYIKALYPNTTSSRGKRDTAEDIEKIMYLEEETIRLGHKTSMLCNLIKQLKTLFWMSSGAGPSTLARELLNTTLITAETRGSHLLVWRCKRVAEWSPANTSLCHYHPKVTYKINKTSIASEGYLNPHTNEIEKRSQLGPCKTHYIVHQNNLTMLRNGSMSVVEDHHLVMKISSAGSMGAYTPPSWEGTMTQVVEHEAPPLTYDDLGDYNPAEETLGSLIGHIHVRDKTTLTIITILILMSLLIIYPIWKLKQEVILIKKHQEFIARRMR